VVLSDTVGFLRNLPHHLVASFRATLAETLDADLLLHVVDASHPDAEIQKASVDRVLEEIGAAGLPRILVLNKADAVRDRITMEVLRQGERDAAVVSAVTGEGLPEFALQVLRFVEKEHQDVDLRVDAGDGRTLAWLAAHGRVLGRDYEGDEVRIKVRLAPSERERLQEDARGVVKVAGR
jgi:GTP-binding protein HflX